MEEIDKILLKLQIKSKREALKELKKKYKDNPKVLKKIKELEEKLPANY